MNLSKTAFKKGDQVVATQDAEATAPGGGTRRRFKKGDRGIVRFVWTAGTVAVRFSRKHSAGCVLVTAEQIRPLSIIEKIADLAE